jgi:hypothetical protein
LCFQLASTFSGTVIFISKAGAYPSGAPNSATH